MSQQVLKSKTNQKMIEELRASCKKRSREEERSYCHRQEKRKRIMDKWKALTEDSRASDADIDKLFSIFENGFDTVWGDINERHGVNGGGEGRIEFPADNGSGHSPQKKTCYGAVQP
jgi:hypothetical protein